MLRRVVGVVSALTLVGIGSYIVWAAQPEALPAAVSFAPAAVETTGMRAPILGDGQIHLATFKAGTARTVLASQAAPTHVRRTILHRCLISGEWVATL